MRRALITTTIGLLLASCGGSKTQKPAGDAGTKGKAKPVVNRPGEKKIIPPLAAQMAPPATARATATSSATTLMSRVQSYFAGHVGRRIYIQVDKPLYKPGETIWIKTWDLRARDLSGKEVANTGMRYQLVSPRGSVVLRKRVRQQGGMATNDFVIPQGVKGGEYKIRALTYDGKRAERPVIISAYEPPRIKKKLEFLRKAYGPGDDVSATIVVKRPTGEALASHPLTGVVMLDGQELPRVQLKTNDKGGGVVRFKLPSEIEKGDGLLTVMVEDGGITESVSKSIPIVLKKVRFSMFPEGGKLVTGIPSRVYFEAKNMIGKPADIEGRVVDDHGNPVERFKSHFHGMGRFELAPATGRTYYAEITKPAGVTERFKLPLALEEGCVLNSFDDPDGQKTALRVSVRCTAPQRLTVIGMLRERTLDTATVDVPANGPAIVYLEPKDKALAKAQGIARVTVFDKDNNPLAERLVFRNRRARLGVRVEPHKKSYQPRDQVTLRVTTTDADGKPMPAEVAMSVVDDTVVSFADDKTGHMLSRLYLESELPEKVEEPKKYFDLTEAKSALALDMLMGTRGWRKFAWRRVLMPPRPTTTASPDIGRLGGRVGGPGRGFGRRHRGEEGAMKRRPRPRRKARRVDALDDLIDGALGGAKKKGARPQGLAKVAKRPAPANKALNEQPRPAADPVPAPREVQAAKPRLVAPAKQEPAPAMAQEPPMPRAKRARRRLGANIRANKDEAKVRDAEEDNKWGAGKGDGDRAAGERLRRRRRFGWAPVRVFPAPTYSGDYSGPRTDFRETLHWQPRVATGRDGTAMVSFYLSDAVTSFRVFTEGVARGLAGRDETVFKSSLPFSMNVKLPLEVSAGDRLRLPLTLTNETNKPLEVSINADFGALVTLEDGQSQSTISLAAGKRQSLLYALKVTGKRGKSAVKIAAKAGSLSDEFTRELTVVPVGFPQEVSLSGEVGRDQLSHAVDLGQAVPGSVTASVRFYPSPVASMVSGLDGMLRQPTGCFEQASSSNYPNVMILGYLKEAGINDTKLLQRASGLLQAGYRKLVSYESKGNGYEWFGHHPAHEALTAYGLLEFADMKHAWGQVDATMVTRTATWLRSRRDGKGGFKRNRRALDSFGRASDEVTNAYIAYSLTEAGFTRGFEKEIAAQAQLAATTQDAYLLALASNTLLNVPERKATGKAAAARLAKMQGDGGVWDKANHSVTRSTGINLQIETTALAVMALLKAGGQTGKVRQGIEWLNKNRGGFGRWGATQATVLSLKAMTAYAKAMRKTQYPGTVIVKIGGKVVARVDYEAGRRDPVEIKDLGQHFTSGSNEVLVSHDGKGTLPYSMAVTFRSERPASSEACVVKLRTELAKSRVKMGENVRLTATVRNSTDRGQPMTLARVGFPGGLTFQTWQLKQLREKGLIAFYETRPREVILYLRQLKPSETRTIPIDLVARVPGHYTGPASSAYLYYTDDQKVWTDPPKLTVEK